MQKDCRDLQFSAVFFYREIDGQHKFNDGCAICEENNFVEFYPQSSDEKKIITPFQMSTAWKNPALEPSFIIILVYFRLLILNKLPISLVIFKILTKFGSKWSSIPRIANFSFFFHFRNK